MTHPAGSILNAIREYAIFTLDADGNITSWNDAAAELTGHSAHEAEGSSYGIFSARSAAGEVARMLQTARDTGSFEQQRWWRHRDGGVIWVEELITPLDDDAFVVVARDRTDRANASARGVHSSEGDDDHGAPGALRTELQVAERRAAFLAEASSILVGTSLDFDSTLRSLARLAVSRIADWCVIHALDEAGNLVCAAATHREPDLDAAVERLACKSLNSRWHEALREVVRTGQSHIIGRLESQTWFTDDADPALIERIGRGSAMVTPLLGRGNVLGAITLVSTDPDGEYDDDELALADELGRRAAIALDNARLFREAQEANRAKTDFLAVMSHELRTPLNAIMGYADLLDAGISGEMTDKQRRQIGRIRASARHLLQLIEEILAYARIEAGGAELRIENVDACGIAEEAAAVIQPMAAEKGLTFELDCQADDMRLSTDPTKARQILVNLLSNAVKFTDQGGVVLRCRRDGDFALFDVIDTGIGIPREQFSQIFDPFLQLERPNTRKVGGTGLGLSVSRRYIRLLHGDITVHSEVGRGTRFTVSLPLRAPGAESRSR